MKLNADIFEFAIHTLLSGTENAIFIDDKTENIKTVKKNRIEDDPV